MQVAETWTGVHTRSKFASSISYEPWLLKTRQTGRRLRLMAMLAGNEHSCDGCWWVVVILNDNEEPADRDRSGGEDADDVDDYYA